MCCNAAVVYDGEYLHQTNVSANKVNIFTSNLCDPKAYPSEFLKMLSLS